MNRLRTAVRRAAHTMRDDGGQATVEAAFALPVVMLLVLLLVQPGIILYDRIVMEGAAAEGCRLLATSTGENAQANEDYIRRRLGAIPQQDLFHVHGSSCSWVIDLQGGEASERVSVTISTEVKPLPLIGAGASALGMTNANGNLVVSVSASQATQPAWAASGGLNPSSWMGAWL